MKSLCTSCRHGHIMKDHQGRTDAYCMDIREFIDKPVEECTTYEVRQTMDRYDMEKIAWLIDPKRKKIGFQEVPEFIPPGDERHKKLTRDY